MTEFSSPHPPGTFCWAELATTDQNAGIAFYRALFGWDVHQEPIGPDEVYSMFRMRGKEVAAAYNMRSEERQQGTPPHWNLYVAVASVEDTAKRAESLGGKVLMAPFDVMDAGRMAVIQDPSGAVFCLWQAAMHIGARILNEPGALCWSELTTRDPKAARAFYTKLFGWTTKSSSEAPVEYTEFSNNGQPGVGMLPMPEQMPANVPSYWMPYFQVGDCDGSAAKAGGLGGKVMIPAQDVSKTGRFAILQDPQGAMFAVFRFAAA